MSATGSTASAIRAYEWPRTPASSFTSARPPLITRPVRARRMPWFIRGFLSVWTAPTDYAESAPTDYAETAPTDYAETAPTDYAETRSTGVVGGRGEDSSRTAPEPSGTHRSMIPGARSRGPRPGRGRAPSRSCPARSEEHTSELQSRFGISYAVFCLKK